MSFQCGHSIVPVSHTESVSSRIVGGIESKPGKKFCILIMMFEWKKCFPICGELQLSTKEPKIIGPIDTSPQYV